jgi:hypothetical protein
MSYAVCLSQESRALCTVCLCMQEKRGTHMLRRYVHPEHTLKPPSQGSIVSAAEIDGTVEGHWSNARTLSQASAPAAARGGPADDVPAHHVLVRSALAFGCLHLRSTGNHAYAGHIATCLAAGCCWLHAHAVFLATCSFVHAHAVFLRLQHAHLHIRHATYGHIQPWLAGYITQ